MNTPQNGTPYLDSIFTALAHEKRRAILHILSLMPDTVGHLAQEVGLSLPAMHKHVRLLEAADLIVRKKSGRTNFLALNPGALGLAKDWINQYNTAWGNPEASLLNYIARMDE